MTERDLLDMLHARYSAEAMGVRRYVVAATRHAATTTTPVARTL